MYTPREGETKNDFIIRCITSSVNEENFIIDFETTKTILDDNLEFENESLDIPNTGVLTSEGLIKNAAKIGAGALLGGPAGAAKAAKDVVTKNKGNILKGLAASKLVKDALDDSPKTVAEMKKPIPSFLASTDTPNNVNKIKVRPKGILISDTYNHPIFPIPLPRIDTSGFDLSDIKKRYEAYYTKLPVDFLPWHYVVEVIEGDYYFFSTRPIDMKFPISTNEAEQLIESNKGFVELNKSAEDFFKNKPFDLQDAIHVAILGDSNKDIYVRKIYEVLARLCAGPYLRYFRLPAKIGQRVIDFNLGNKFHINQLDMYLRR